jgi:hypothetical protein
MKTTLRSAAIAAIHALLLASGALAQASGPINFDNLPRKEQPAQRPATSDTVAKLRARIGAQRDSIARLRRIAQRDSIASLQQAPKVNAVAVMYVDSVYRVVIDTVRVERIDTVKGVAPQAPSPAVLAGPLAAQTPAATPGFDFSGVAFGSFSMKTDSASKASLGGQSPNSFSLDRAYLTFRMPAGDNGSIRITTDISQNTNAATNGFYQGWFVRLKYAYFQYAGLKDQFGTGSSLTGRVGILHTVVIDHQEAFWPRYLQQTALEKNGFFSSADAGVAGLLTLGNKMGEIYATVTNGPGYTAVERDRFKDFAARLTLTPLANSSTGILKTFAISPWFYLGKVGSTFQAGGANQVGPGTNGAITDGLDRNRYGIFAGVKDRRLTGGVEFAQRKDQSDNVGGANTVASPRAVADSTGRLLDGFVIARPLEWIDASKHSALSLVARFDKFTPNTGPTSANYAGTTPSYRFVVLGGSWDLTSKITVALDWQNQSPSSFPPATGTNVKPTPQASTLFLHWQANF